ncbi:MAG: hypothetical protein HS105_03070 [Chloracidobacterium sp.]|mgnify:CR=1 FL=1|nr:hypothetical protein [Chloracidobacterium sp.]MCO5334450.1 hypothetical protein [Pyrinomonadaceae bacterium]
MIDIEKAIVAMASNNVDFVVIGGIALSIHATAYITFDIDFAYSRSNENLVRIVKALAPYEPRPRGFPKQLPFIWDAATLSNGSVFTLDTSIGDIDLLSEVKGLGDFADVFAASEKFELWGFDVNVLSIDGLIAAKTAAGREKDIPGLKYLEAIKEATADEGD